MNRWRLSFWAQVTVGIASVLAAGALGNVTLAPRIPQLRTGVPIVPKSLLLVLTGPDSICEWLFGRWTVVVLVAVFLASFLAQLVLTVATPLVDRVAAIEGAEQEGISVAAAYAQLRAYPGAVKAVRSTALRRLLPRSALVNLSSFIVGLVAAAGVWGSTELVNRIHSSIFSWIVVSLAVLVLSFVVELTRGIPEALGGDVDTMLDISESLE